jgi:hypothetical protein
MGWKIQVLCNDLSDEEQQFDNILCAACGICRCEYIELRKLRMTGLNV